MREAKGQPRATLDDVLSTARVLVALLLLSSATMLPMPASAAEPSDALTRALKHAGAERDWLAPDSARIDESPTRAQQLPLYRALMADPLRAAYRVGMLESTYRAEVDSPHGLMSLTGSLAGADVARGSSGNPFDELDEILLAAPDPLQAGLAVMVEGLDEAGGWTPVWPSEAALPRPLRTEIGRVLAVIGQANRLRLRAFAALPEAMTPSVLLRQAIEGRHQAIDEPDFRDLLPLIDRNALMAGMQDLVAAIEDLEHFLATTPALPAVSWRLETPLGLVMIDTTGADNHHVLHDPLFIVDVGGDDTYTFTASDEGGRISILLDHGGDDRYIARDPAACPAAAVMGYGILWDTEGDDHYEGDTLAQAAALFGAALLVDGGGDDRYTATGFAQAYALGGAALLVSMSGDDSFDALTHAQGSAGPGAAAVLLNVAGDDRYTLGNDRLVLASPQLPDRNVSMGQGAGRGIRADHSDGRSTSGGIGALFDFEGDDRYTAQVFAQGVGFFEGAGLLVDGGGTDVFDGAWYAMAASAHRAAGVLVSRGAGDDTYTASHSTSIGAAHDFSMAFFIDEGGDDRYMLGDLGLGGAHDNSIAIFADVTGDDHYSVRSRRCLAFGAAHLEEWGTLREDLPNVGLFFDLGGSDTYAAHCSGPANDATWPWPRRHAAQNLRSEAGAGVDGEFPSPFHTQPRTPSANTAGPASAATRDARRAWRSDPRYSPGS